MISVVLPIRTTNPMNGDRGMTRNFMFAKVRERKRQRSITLLVMRAALKGVNALPCVITLTRVAPSNGLDDDSLPASAKSIRDGIADALGLKSDRDPAVTWRYEQRRGPAHYYAVEVEVRSHNE